MRWIRGMVAFAVGSVMSAALVVGHIANPKTVRSFLDVFGEWNPALLVFMTGCVLPYFVLNRIAQRRGAPVLEGEICVAGKTQIDSKLIAGSAIFGFGWGLVGVCPGPAFASMATGGADVLGFVAAMAAGTFAYELLQRRLAAGRARLTHPLPRESLIGRA